MANYYNRNSNLNSNNNSSNTNARRRNGRDINTRDTNFSQRNILDLYVNMYNNTSRQIELLNINLNEIRHTIDYLVRNRNNELNELNEEYENYSTRERINNYRRNPNPNPNPNPNLNPNPNNHSNSNSTNLIHQSNIISENLNDILVLLQSYSNLTTQSRQSNTEIIENTTRLVPYNEIENPINDRCPILHEIFQETQEVRQIIPCGHIFSNTELLRWFERNLHCPVCRYNLRENVSIGNNNSILDNNSENNINEDISGNLIENSVNRIGYDIRYDISGNYLLFETFLRNT